MLKYMVENRRLGEWEGEGRNERPGLKNVNNIRLRSLRTRQPFGLCEGVYWWPPLRDT